MMFIDEDLALPRWVVWLVVLLLLVSAGSAGYALGATRSPAEQLRAACVDAVASFDAFKADLREAYLDEQVRRENERMLIVGAGVIQ